MQYVIVTVGKTHSGKTTFGLDLKKKLKHCTLIDGDVVADFLKTNFSDMYDDDYIKGTVIRSSGAYLKRAVFQKIFEHALQETHLPVILTNSNPSTAHRKEGRMLAHQAKRKFIIVYLNRPEDVLVKRIYTTKRPRYSQAHFEDFLLNKQSIFFQAPDKKEADIFFEIHDENSRKKAITEILKLIKK